MNQQDSLTFAQSGASQADWQGAAAVAGRPGGGTAQSASALAAQWQSVLRPATVPLLPPPSLEAETSAPRVTADGDTGPAALPAQPAPAATPAAPSTSASTPQSASTRVDLHGVLVVALSIILVLLVAYLVAGPFGARVPVLQPLHNALAGVLPRG